MNWIAIAWSMVAACCYTLAAIQCLAWLRDRERREYLAFTAAAAGMGTVTLVEMSAMLSHDVANMVAMHRWVHVPVFFIYAGSVMFVRLYFGTGRRWLGNAIIAARAVAAPLSLVAGDGLFFTRIESLRHVPLAWGQSIMMPVGQISLLHVLDVATLLALLVFVIDAALTLRARAPEPVWRRAALFAWSIGFFNASILVHVPLTHFGIVNLPYMVGWSSLPTLLVMMHVTSADLLQAARLARDLQISEASLRESEQRLATAADAGAIALWIWDFQGRGLWCNDHTRRLFGVDADQHMDLERFLANVHPDDLHEVRSATRAALSGGQCEFDLRVLLPGGDVRWLAVRGFVDTDATGQATLMRGASVDITARRRLELEFRTQRDELAHLSRVTMLGELSGAIAHELNQPLAAILSNAQAAQRFLASGPEALDEVREILADIVAEDRRAGEVIYRLRKLLRKGELELEEVPVNEMVQEVLKLLRSDMINRRVNLHTEFADGDISVRAARVQVQQVLVNLIVNACDALEGVDETGRLLTVRTAAPRDGYVLVSVEDNGPGIPALDHQRIFEPFVTTKRHGMGLGLAVCRTIVLAHGGQLWADPGNGPGARLCFTLPQA